MQPQGELEERDAHGDHEHAHQHEIHHGGAALAPSRTRTPMASAGPALRWHR